MIRVIKRYESRKLYDTEESRYVSLEDLAQWVREGQEVKVVDNATGEDVTPQILTQVILDEGKRGTSFLPTELLHELVRAGERAFQSGVEQVQTKVDRLVRRSIDRLAPVRQAREEMSLLRERLGELETTLIKLEHETVKPKAAKKTAAKKTATKKTATAKKAPAAKKTVAKKTAAKKTAAKKTAAKKTVAKKATTTKAAAKKPATATKTTAGQSAPSATTKKTTTTASSTKPSAASAS